MFIEHSFGMFRSTLKIGKLIFKYPRFSPYSFFYIIEAWAQNLNELRTWNWIKASKWDESNIKTFGRYCPIYFSFLGLINVMPYCIPCKKEDYEPYYEFKGFGFTDDAHVRNFGYLKNELTCFDYGLSYYKGTASDDRCHPGDYYWKKWPLKDKILHWFILKGVK
jgi:hypothetical protein